MHSRTLVWREVAQVALGLVLCSAAMMGVFALLGQWNRTVLIGGSVGALLAMLNFWFMALSTSMAADKAQNQDVTGGQVLVQISYILRMVGLFVLLFLCAKSGKCNIFALLLPLVFVRPIILVMEFLRKRRERNA